MQIVASEPYEMTTVTARPGALALDFRVRGRGADRRITDPAGLAEYLELAPWPGTRRELRDDGCGPDPAGATAKGVTTGAGKYGG